MSKFIITFSCSWTVILFKIRTFIHFFKIFSYDIVYCCFFLLFSLNKTSYILSLSLIPYILCTYIQMQSILFSAYFNLLIKFIFFLWHLESSCFCFVTIYPHGTQVISYSYGSKVFRQQCLQFVPYFQLFGLKLIPFNKCLLLKQI